MKASEDNSALLTEVYQDLRKAARRLLYREASDISLSPTELVNEASLRILALRHMSFTDRQHLFATCSRILRQTLFDEIRKRRSLKRQIPDITLVIDAPDSRVDAEALEEALARLEMISPELATIVDMRYFVGLTTEEVAAATGLAERTVKRRWQTARAWLAQELDDSPQPPLPAQRPDGNGG